VNCAGQWLAAPEAYGSPTAESQSDEDQRKNPISLPGTCPVIFEGGAASVKSGSSADE
jgi:hypothetical protein